MPRSAIMILVLLAALLLPAAAHAADCEGRCEGPGRAVATVSAGTCGADEECRAGCDRGAEGPARPYATCVSRATGEPVPPRVVVPTNVRRE